MLWSAPRCRSTAFLRMMMERGDFLVLHEPFSHVADFGSAQVGDRTVHDEAELLAGLRELGERQPVFVKDTTDFRYPGLLADADFLRRATHTFMIRDPRAAIASHLRLNPDLGRDEIGFAWLGEIFDAVRDATGERPVVIDGDDLVAHPEEVVRAYCERVGIPFLPHALSWRSGMVDQWRRTARWHAEVSETSGFERRPPARTAPEDHPLLARYLPHHLPHYERMHAVRLTPEAAPAGR